MSFVTVIPLQVGYMQVHSVEDLARAIRADLRSVCQDDADPEPCRACGTLHKPVYFKTIYSNVVLRYL